MSYLASQQHNDVLAVCKRLVAMTETQQNALLDKAADRMAVPQVALVDPGQVRLAAPRQRRMIDAAVDDGQGDFDMDARKDIYIQQVLDQAFLVNQQALKSYMQKHLGSGRKVSTRELPIENAKDFLAVAHAIGLGAADGLSSEFEFRIEYDEQSDIERADGAENSATYFLKKDHFTFELVQKES